jgi:geranylgeranyl reductase family protein
MTGRHADVAVVGGGPAGALTAMLLARAGHDVVLLERAPAWRWRACGVFASPASIAALGRIGLGLDRLGPIAQPIPAMEVVSSGGTRFRLTYGGTGELASSAVGFDRGALDPALQELARAAGAEVRLGETVERVVVEDSGGTVAVAGHEDPIEARVVVGADGLRSIVARSAGVARRSPLGARAALSFHVPDVRAGAPRDARMCVFEHGYVGLAPVPGTRVNVGIVLEREWFGRLRELGGREVARRVLTSLPVEDDRALADVEPIDRVAGVTPLGHAVARRAGPSWLLVGDAAGFLDPFTGEGIHRAIASAELAAESIDGLLRGGPARSLERYEQAMHQRFGGKDLVSRLIQGFLGKPALFDYAARRLATRSGIRETMALVIGDLAPASRVLDPGFLAALLAP